MDTKIKEDRIQERRFMNRNKGSERRGQKKGPYVGGQKQTTGGNGPKYRYTC